MAKRYIGGYAILDLTSGSVYADALKCIDNGKPVMIYDYNETYFADTIAKSGDDVVITKGGKTITITDANSVSSEGYIQGYKKYLIIMVTDNANYYINTMLNNMKFKRGETITINNEIFNYLENSGVFSSMPCNRDDDEFVALIYDVNDSETFKIDTRYLDNGVITSGVDTIISVNFREL